MSKRKRRHGLNRGQIIGLAAACVGIAAVIGSFVVLMSKNKGGKDGSVDIDFSAMSLEAASGLLTQMAWEEPDEYLGQTVRAKGQCRTQFINGTVYYYCSFAGSDSCCSYGLEFRYSGTKPKPKDGQAIEIVGKYSEYLNKNDDKVVNYYVQVTELTRV